MTTPPLSQATGTENSPIFIRDVVQRVKCELSDAFDKKTSQPQFLWLADWTAHVDLTLSINDNAGLSAGVTHTDFTGKSIARGFPLTSQFFTVAAGANLSGQAIRSETVSFTVALDELKMWRRHIDRIESDPKFPPEQKICNFSSAIGVTGNLGLGEWVDSAFYPAEIGQLQAGIHTAGGGKASSVKAPSSSPSAKSAAQLTVGAALKRISDWENILTTLVAETMPGRTAIASAKNDVSLVENQIKTKIDDAKQYRYVLAPYLQERYAKVQYLIRQYSNDVGICTDAANDITQAQQWATKLQASLKGANPTDIATNVAGFDDTLFGQLDALMEEKIKVGVTGIGTGKPDVKKSQYAVLIANCVKAFQAAKDLPNKLPAQIDPPLDSLSHSLTFTVSYGANVTPSWTLVQWKGPGGNGNFLSASGVMTHNMVIALGPRAGAPAIGQDAIRLIQLQAIRSINQQ
ncbi:MAG: hypothetical protein WBX25_22985 [Rhodomicrobium sp.]